MMAPFPGTMEDVLNRIEVDKILEECWKNPDAGYEIQPTDEWIVNNQQQQQDGYYFDILEQDTFVEDTTIARKKPSTYGEITSLGARQLFGVMGLLDCPQQKQELPPIHFFDLGSGTGKLVGQVILELPHDRVISATGIELSPSRHESAIRAKETLMRLPGAANDWSKFTKFDDGYRSNNDIGDSLSQEVIRRSKNSKLELIEGDLFDADISTATHIYVASLCFPHNLMVRLEERLQTLLQHQQEHPRNHTDDGSCPEDCVLQWVASLQPFPNNLGGIRPVVRFMQMSWTKPLGCAVYLYRCSDKRRNDREGDK